MKLPLSIAVAVTGQDAGDTEYEVFLNRIGINSIEAPKTQIQVEIGGNLRLKFLNRGSPIHITVASSNIGPFSSFFHDNLYIVDETLFTIPIRNDCHEGFFDLEIITGYGATREAFRVDVIQPTGVFLPRTIKEAPVRPLARGRPHPLMVMMGIALVLYSAWLYFRLDVLNTVSFITLVIGAIYTWYRQGSQ